MESRNNTSSMLIDDVDITNNAVGEVVLSLPVQPNKRCKVSIFLPPIEAVPVNVDLNFNSQSRFTGRKIMNSSQGSTDFFYQGEEIEGAFFGYGQDPNANLAIEGIFTTGLVSDVLKVRVRQATEDPTETFVPSGSYLIVTPLD